MKSSWFTAELVSSGMSILVNAIRCFNARHCHVYIYWPQGTAGRRGLKPGERLGACSNETRRIGKPREARESKRKWNSRGIRTVTTAYPPQTGEWASTVQDAPVIEDCVVSVVLQLLLHRHRDVTLWRAHKLRKGREGHEV